MKIEGTYTLHAPPGRVWHAMQNPQVLRQIVPGLEKIEAIDDHTFTLSLVMNQAPFAGTHQGRTTITERQYPYHFRVAIQSKSDQGSLRSEININLQDREESTVVAYAGTIQLDPGGKRSSITLARGAAKLLLQQFFTALNDQLHAQEVTDADFAAVIENYDVFNIAGNSIIKNTSSKLRQNNAIENVTLIPGSLLTSKTEERQSIFCNIVHVLKIGDGELEQERLWAQRLRLGSLILGLLFLMWAAFYILRRQQRR